MKEEEIIKQYSSSFAGLFPRTIKVILFILFLTITPYFIYRFVSLIFLANYGGNFIGAFFGAFFAALSTILYEIFLKYCDKEKERYNTLVLFDLQLLKCRMSLADISYQINAIISQKGDPLRVILHRISQDKIAISDEAIIMVRHVGIKNKLISISRDVTVINSDVESIMSTYNANVQIVLNEPIDKDAKLNKINTLNESLIMDLTKINRYLAYTQEEIVDCAAGIHAMSVIDRPSYIKYLYQLFVGYNYNYKLYFEKKLTERKIIDAQIKIDKEASKNNIDKIMEGINSSIS